MELKQRISEEMEETRLRFQKLLKDLPDEVLEEPSDNPAWTVRQVLFHMSLAPRMLSTDLKMILSDRWYYRLIPAIIPRSLFDTLNKWSAKYSARNATRESLAEEYDKAHLAAQNALATVDEGDFDKYYLYPNWDPHLSGEVTIEKLFRYVKIHFDSHENEIRGVHERLLEGGKSR